MAVAQLLREGNLLATPIRDLGLTIEGSRLEPVLREFERELERVGIHQLRPHFFLSTEWFVNDGTIAVAIPFYLARTELIALHADRAAYVEGGDRAELLRYLRHEMGHVVNYAYELHERADWIEMFGPMSKPYRKDYRPEPFSRDYVRHLPGWYAQKHPDEDWSETFAVWMTPGSNWRRVYADWPMALAKLQFCDRLLAEVRTRAPIVTRVECEEDVSEVACSLEQYYGPGGPPDEPSLPTGLDGALLTIFDDLDLPANGTTIPQLSASALIQRVEKEVMANVYRWTGHFPERTWSLLRHLADRAEALNLLYSADRESSVLMALTTLVSGLAMNYVLRGGYMP